MKWIDWTKTKPTKPGYYLFFLMYYGPAYNAMLTQKYDYYDPNLKKYGIMTEEFYVDHTEFCYISAWGIPEEFPVFSNHNRALKELMKLPEKPDDLE